MKNIDRQKFAAEVITTLATYGRETNAAVVAKWWQALEPYTWTQVVDAINAHMSDPQDGRYPPTPAHVIAKLAPVREYHAKLPPPSDVLPKAEAKAKLDNLRAGLKARKRRQEARDGVGG